MDDRAPHNLGRDQFPAASATYVNIKSCNVLAMSDAGAIIFLTGAVSICVVFAVLFTKRYPKRPAWLAAGAAIGIAAMFLWPITIWVALAMWLTGFARHRIRSRDDPLDRAGAGRAGAGETFPRRSSFRCAPSER